MTDEDVKRVEFNCPVKLLQNFDEAIKGYYRDRTEALVELMRDLCSRLEERKHKISNKNSK